MESALITEADRGRLSEGELDAWRAVKNEEAPRPNTLSRSSVLPEAVGPVTMMTLIGDEAILHLLVEDLLRGQRHHFSVVLLDFGRLEHG
jgi:hypothetical protein